MVLAMHRAKVGVVDLISSIFVLVLELGVVGDVDGLGG